MATRRQHIRNTRTILEAGTPLIGEYPYDTTLKTLRIGDGSTLGGYAKTKQWGLSYVVSPPQITANQNDYSPTDLAIAETLQINSDAARNITGIALGALNRRLTIVNNGSFNITLSDASASSTAANRYAFGEDVVLRAGGAVDLQYDATASRWRRASSGVKLASIPEELLLRGVISPSQITANQNDYAPANVTLATVLRLNSDASRNITGLADARDGATKEIVNVGSFAIVLKNADAGSTAANRFDFGADQTIAAKQGVRIRYDATDSRWKLVASTAGAAVADGGATAVKLGTSALGARSGIINGTLTVTHNTPGANQLTIALKSLAGTDPTASDPVRVVFQNGSGGFAVVDVTAALSLVLSAGSSFGFTNASAGRLWYPLIYTGSAVVIGAVNCLSGASIFPLHEGIPYTTTAEGGAGAADNTQTIYTASAQTSKYICLGGYSDWDSGVATAGNWATAPSRTLVWSPGMPRPGEVIQQVLTQTGASSAGATAIPLDNTIPQITEGDQYMTQAIVPLAPANVLKIRSVAFVSNNAVGWMLAALFQDATANALAAGIVYNSTATGIAGLLISYAMKAATASSTTFRIRAGVDAGGGTLTFNGRSSVQSMGGVMASFLEVEELMG